MMGYDLPSSNKRQADALGASQDDGSKRARHMTPSRVIHARNLPADCTENDLYMLATPFGQVVNVLLLKGKNQAFIQMAELISSTALVEFYTVTPAMVRNNTVYLQYSNREEITAPSAGGGGGGGGSFSNKHETPNAILLATVSNLVYPTTVDVLHQIFSKYGTILRIVTFTKNGNFQALIQFQDLSCAIAAKAHLDGQNIYVGCCTLRIQFSTLTDLEVKYNNDKSRDFTNPNLPTGNASNNNNNAAAQAAAAAAAANAAAAGFDYVDPNYLQFQYGAAAAMPGGYLVPGVGKDAMGLGVQGSGNSVLIVSGLNTERVTPETLFTLFGVYGDVQRVKILFNKKDTALVQMSHSQQADMVMAHLNGAVVYGSPLRINVSKHQSVNVNKNPTTEEESAKYTKDFTNSPAHRYKQVGSKNYQHICPPSTTLHISGIPPSASEPALRLLFGQYGTVIGFKYFVNDKKMALIQMATVPEAIEALINLHDRKIDEAHNSIRVSFAKSTIS